MCVTDFNTADVWDEQSMVARKIHRCSECQGRIFPGEPYTRIGMLYDGEWTTLRLCQGCDWLWFVMTHVVCARRPADEHVHPGRMMVGILAEEIKEHDADGYDEQGGQMLALVAELRGLYRENRDLRRPA